MPPEPAVVTPSPREPEPVATRSEPPGDLRLDVASVCEALFDPKVMSYESQPAVRRPVQGRDGPVEGYDPPRERLLVRFRFRGRRRNEGRI